MLAGERKRKGEKRRKKKEECCLSHHGPRNLSLHVKEEISGTSCASFAYHAAPIAINHNHNHNIMLLILKHAQCATDGSSPEPQVVIRQVFSLSTCLFDVDLFFPLGEPQHPATDCPLGAGYFWLRENKREQKVVAK
ncbi:hypothetical protein TWF694_009747 [Orbilia ellipsospora]|uniref:Uncharacterized protein n=1 Tax=Orbilia ellipsospora TaxID=2528407 RepID=A0AAV9XCY0_9PEZI